MKIIKPETLTKEEALEMYKFYMSQLMNLIANSNGKTNMNNVITLLSATTDKYAEYIEGLN